VIVAMVVLQLDNCFVDQWTDRERRADKRHGVDCVPRRIEPWRSGSSVSRQGIGES
jgi:hypothetical protein